MTKYLLILSSLGIYKVNPIQSLLWLVVVFMLASMILIELGSEFLAILLIMVYVGAIAVLFLFVIMLLNIRKIELYNNYINYLPVVVIIGTYLFFELLFIIYLKINNILILDYLTIDFIWIKSLYYTSNIKVIGILLYDVYYYYFFFLGLLLLTALLGTLILLVNTTEKQGKVVNLHYKKKKWKY